MRRRIAGENGRHAPRRDFAQLQRIAANVNRHVDDRVFADAHRRRQVGRRLFQRGKLIAQRFELRLCFLGIEFFKLLGKRRVAGMCLFHMRSASATR